MPPRRPRHLLSQSGFTLVELLTVIAIIGVLAAIIIPVVGKVKNSARSAQCVSNLRFTYMGIMNYVSDHRGMLPPGYVATTAENRAKYGYDGGFMDYYGGLLSDEMKATLGCPVQRSNKEDRWKQNSWWNARVFPRTFGMNIRLSQTGPGQPVGPRAMASFEAPARSLLIGDGDNSDNGGDTDYYNSSLQPGRYPEPVHNDRGNVVYLDGHVGSLARQDIPTSTSTPEARLFWYGNSNP